LLRPLLARPHRHAPILQTKPVDTSTLSAHESDLAPRAVRQLFKCFRALIADFHRSTPGGKGTFIADPIAALVGRTVKRTLAGDAQISALRVVHFGSVTICSKTVRHWRRPKKERTSRLSRFYTELPELMLHFATRQPSRKF
jgi:hypothetical protein